jgi:hypothetical protein
VFWLLPSENMIKNIDFSQEQNVSV